MKISDDLFVPTAIVCDDVRREWNGKDLLIGVYGSGIKFDSIPNFLICSLWLELNVKSAGDFDMFVRVVDNNKQVLFQPPTSAKLKVPEPGFSNIALPGIALNIGSTGMLEFQLSANGENWTTVRSLNVLFGPINPIVL